MRLYRKYLGFILLCTCSNDKSLRVDTEHFLTVVLFVSKMSKQPSKQRKIDFFGKYYPVKVIK